MRIAAQCFSHGVSTGPLSVNGDFVQHLGPCGAHGRDLDDIPFDNNRVVEKQPDDSVVTIMKQPVKLKPIATACVCAPFTH